MTRNKHWFREISSTEVRGVMRAQDDLHMQLKLEELALSAEILLHHKSIWASEAKLGQNNQVRFPSRSDEDLGPGVDDWASIDAHSGSSYRSISVGSPEVIETDMSESESDLIELDTIKPDAVQPEMIELDILKPITNQPDAIEPDNFEPDIIEPDAMDEETIQQSCMPNI